MAIVHKAKVVGAPIVLSDGAIAIVGRCCDDPLTDSTCTIYKLHELDTVQVQQQIEGHLGNMEMKHLAKDRAQNAIAAMRVARPDLFAATEEKLDV